MENFKANRLDLPKTLLGSNKKIFFFKIYAAKQNGNVIYPPVLIKIFVLFFFIKLIDLNTFKKYFKIFIGSK